MDERTEKYRFLVFTLAVGFEELLLSVQPVPSDGMRKFRSSVERVRKSTSETAAYFEKYLRKKSCLFASDHVIPNHFRSVYRFTNNNMNLQDSFVIK